MTTKNTVKKKVKTQEMEFIDGRKVTREFLERNGAISAQGKVNERRIEFLEGRGGSRKEETWNEKEHKHTCCKSKVSWRHKVDCPRLT